MYDYFYLCLPQLDLGKDFKFLLQEIHLNFTRKIIGENHEVPETTHGVNPHTSKCT